MSDLRALIAAVDWTAVFTGSLFVATIWLVRVTQKLVTGAEETSKRQLTAYVSVAPTAMVTTHAQALDIHSQSVRIQTSCKNHGQTPARKLRFRYEVDVMPFPVSPLYEFPLATKVSATDLAIFQGTNDGQIFVREQPLTPQELDAIGHDTARIYCWGVATYFDIFNQNRYVEFCFSVVGGQFTVWYLKEFLRAVAAGQKVQLPPGMPHPFNFDYHGKHGHGN